MKSFMRCPSVMIFSLIVCITQIPLEATEESQTLASLDNLESCLSQIEEVLDNTELYLIQQPEISITEPSFNQIPEPSLMELSFTQLQETVFIEPSLTHLPEINSPFENSLDRSGEALTKIKSLFDEKDANLFYLRSELAKKTVIKEDDLYQEIEAFKDEILGDSSLTKEERGVILRQTTKALLNLGKDKEALQLCRDFLDRYPKNKADVIGLYYLIGVSSQGLKRYGQALEAYHEAILYAPRCDLVSHIRVDIGWCYYKKGEYEKAINEYARALEEGFLDSTSVQWAWFETGRCHFFLKNYEDAIEAFQRVLNLNPDAELAQQAKTNIKDIEKLKNGWAS